MNTAAPTTERIRETGTSKGRMMIRPTMSDTVTIAIPSRHTQGRFVRRLSPRNIATTFGTMRPRNGRFPTTTVTTPVATAMSPGPRCTTWRKFSPTFLAMSSPGPATVNRSAAMNTPIATTSTTHSGSYCPLRTVVKEPANQIPRLCNMLVESAKNEEIAPTTAPSMIPTIGTMTEDRSVTRCRNMKKIMVPMNAVTTATDIFITSDGEGKRIIVMSSPSPAHSVVPVVVGSTNRFWVSTCMTNPDIAIEAPASTSAIRSEEHTSELQSRGHLVCRLLVDNNNKCYKE